MNRHFVTSLLNWKQASNRKPLLLQGARQVGKTHLLRAFGREHFERLAYINFERMPEAHSIFERSKDPKHLIEKLSILLEVQIEVGKTLLFFDEIQAAPNALVSLKYFAEELPELHVAAAGSLLGVVMSGARSFPVGKVQFMHLYPMHFQEFLDAIGKSGYRELLQKHDVTVPLDEIFHNELMDLLRTYLVVGGMPEAVKVYIDTRDLLQCREVQENILQAYRLDFSKYAEPTETLKISAVWQSLPAQLAREYRKFTYSLLGKSARGREYERAIQWLSDAGLILQVYSLKKPQLPLAAYQEPDAFKAYCLDVGLLGAMARLDIKQVLSPSALFTEFKGALAENLVAQELTANDLAPLYYWTDSSRAEVDFVLQQKEQEQGIFPVEVKAGENKRKTSLKKYEKRFSPERMVRISSRGFKRDDRLQNLPLYAVRRIS
ncbi:AAA family ATPase [Bdellovibrionota bacterium FG-1]